MSGSRMRWPIPGGLWALWLLVGLVTTPLGAESARGLVREGNRAYAKAEYGKALEAYGKASVEAPESPVVAFDRGAALFKKGEMQKAREAFESAALKARDLPFEARCRYNVANVDLRQAQRQRDADPRKAVAFYEQAIRGYQDALRLRPGYPEAAHNLEVARILLKSLLDELSKDPGGSQQRQQENEDLRKELERLVGEQVREAQRSGDLARRQDRGEKGLSAETRSLSRDQEGTRDGTGKLSEKMDQLQKGRPQQGPSAIEKAREEVDRAHREQGEASESLRQGNPKKAKPDQEQAAEHLKKALEELGGDPQQCSSGQQQPQGGQDQKQKDQQGQKPDAGPKPQQEQQAKAAASGRPKEDEKPRGETPQDLLREEQENRRKQMQNVQGGYAPVDKDW